MNDAEALKLLIKKKELGITDQELESFKQSLNPKSYVQDLKAEEIVRPASPLDDLTEEEILYYATPYFDELQARKEAMKNQRKEDEALNG